MKRVHLFEFEDYKWFPQWIRNNITKLIVVLHKMMGVEEVLAKLCSEILKDNQIDKIVDLGSGAGGAMPGVLSTLHSQYGLTDTQLLLTDRYPNANTIKSLTESKLPISYNLDSVDATQLDKVPLGLRTMINSFHHMDVGNAKKIIESAQKSKQPLLIYEMAENKIPLFLWWLLLPISLIILIVMVFFMTPFTKPIDVRQLLFTYLIPIIPICYAWDGQASMPRMYTFDDFNELLKGVEDENYTWKKGRPKNNKGKIVGSYFLGLPRSM